MSNENVFNGIIIPSQKQPNQNGDPQLLSISSDGTVVNSGTTVQDISASFINSSSVFSAYDSNGGQAFSSGTITVTYDSNFLATPDFSLAGGEVTHLADAVETYIVAYSVSTEIDSGSSRSCSFAWMELDTGSGYAEIAGTRVFMYNRVAGNAANTGTAAFVLTLAQNHKVRVRAARYTGTDTMRTIANGSQLLILSAQGARGPAGPAGADGDISWEGTYDSMISYLENQAVEFNGSSYVANETTSVGDSPASAPSKWDLFAAKGDTGAGSTVFVQTGGVDVSGGPFDTLNFQEGFFSVEAGAVSGSADISVNFAASDTFPPSPQNGQQHFRTDLEWNFTWDSSRSKWLGDVESDGGGANGSSGNNSFMKRFNGMAMSSTTGIYIPYDITIVGLSICNSNSVTGDIQVVRNGSSNVISTLSLSAQLASGDMTLNDNFSANGVMAFYWTNASDSLSNPQVRVWFRRRAS